MLRRLDLFRFFLPCILLGMVLIGFGGKLGVIQHYGSPVPDAAQWRSGVTELAPEWAAGTVVLARPTAPVELPVLARAILGATIHANGQWDDRVTLVLNAGLLVLTFALLLASAGRRLGWTATWAAAACAGLLVALPLDGGQSLVGSALPDRLALLLAFPAAWLLFEHSPAAPAWWAGAAALVLANTAADWAVAPTLAVGLVALGRTFTRPASRLRDCATLGIVLVGTGLHAALHPDRWAQLGRPVLSTFALDFAEPWPTLPWVSLVVYAPLVIRLALGARDGDRKRSLAPFAAFVGAAALALLWLAAEPPARRWGTGGAATDIQLLVTALAFATLTQLWHLRWRSAGLRLGLTVVWIAVLVAGLDQRLRRAVDQGLPAHAAESRQLGEALARCLLDPAARAGLPADLRSERLAARLADPALRAILPYPLREPVPVRANASAAGDFAPLDSALLPLPPSDAPAWATAPAGAGGSGAPFVSQPLPPSSTGVLRFQVAGDLGTARFPFALRSDRTGSIVPLELAASTGERWRTVNLPRPAEAVTIVAGPAAPGAWGAFTAPVELGTLSWYAGKLAKSWPWVLAAGIGGFLVALALPFAPRRVRRETTTLGRDGRLRVTVETEA